MNEQKQHPLWVRVVASLVAYVFDNFLVLFAVGMLCRLSWETTTPGIVSCIATAFILVMLAIYQKLVEIRDNLQSPDVTMNFVTEKTEGEKP